MALLALVLGLAPLGGELPEVPVDPALDVRLEAADLTVSASDGQVSLQAPVVGPLAVRTCDRCPLLELGPGAQDAPAEPAPAGGPSGDSGFLPGDLTPPQAVAATSLSALLLGALAWLAPRLAAAVPFFGFSRIDDDALARHPKRQLALQLVAANPGCNLQELRQGLGLAWGTTVYHMSRLEKAGLVAVRHIAGQRTHWPVGGAPPSDALPPTSRALASLVQARPGLDQGELARLLGVGAGTACKQLARLEAAGLVLAQRVGHSRRYVGTPRLATTPML